MYWLVQFTVANRPDLLQITGRHIVNRDRVKSRVIKVLIRRDIEEGYGTSNGKRVLHIRVGLLDSRFKSHAMISYFPHCYIRVITDHEPIYFNGHYTSCVVPTSPPFNTVSFGTILEPNDYWKFFNFSSRYYLLAIVYKNNIKRATLYNRRTKKFVIID